MKPELRLPDDFHDYAWEVEAKGVLLDATVRVGDSLVPVTFYDPVRLGQDVTEELAERSAFVLERTIVVPFVTEQHMRAAVRSVPPEFFR